MTGTHPGLDVLAVAFLLAATLASVSQICVRAIGQSRATELLASGEAGRVLRAWLDNPLPLLVTTLIVRLVGVAAAAWWVSRRLGGWLGDTAGWWGLVGTLFGYVVFVEIGLATWAKLHAEAAARVALPLYAPVDVLLWPLGSLLALLAGRWAGMLSGGDEQAIRSGPFLSEEDMARLWGLAPEAGQAPQQEHKLLQGVMDFQEAVVRDVMVPRPRIAFVDADAGPDDALKAFGQHGHTRMLVCQGTLDRVLGVLFLTDLVRQRATGNTALVRSTMRRPYFVPELMKVTDLLREFQRRRTHVAVVVDEFGTTSGMVTLQDVVEEIVGDVRDETDPAGDSPIREIRPGAWLMDARTSVGAAAEVLGVEIPETGAYETVGGYLITQAGRLPVTGTVIKRLGFAWTVKEADERRLGKVQVERDGSGESAPPPARDPDPPVAE